MFGYNTDTMLRSRFLTAHTVQKRGFRPRGKDVSRLEAFSDCVFAFALTLIVVALEVPRTVEQLFAAMKSFPVFGVCFAILLDIWWEHHTFFRRYGITDLSIFLLNGVLLFVVLFFVYPLRFLFSVFLSGTPVDAGSARDLFTIYGGGYLAVFVALALMHLHAWRLREKLELDELEQWMTLQSLAKQAVLAAFGLLSVAIARLVPPQYVGLAGWIFFGIPIPMTFLGTWFGRRIDRLQEAPG